MALGLGLGLTTSRRGGGGGGGGGASADYYIYNDTDWTNLMGLSAATLSGKTVEIRGALTNTVLSNKNFSSALTIRGGVGGSIRLAQLGGTLGPLIFDGVTFQMTGWPGSDCLLYFDSGNYSETIIRNCTFRHGYWNGSALVDTPTNDRASIEYIKKPVTSHPAITAATSRVALSAPAWAYTGAAVGSLTITNSGATTIYVKPGDSAVVATTADQAIAAGASYVWSASALPLPTHVAAITASGSSAASIMREQGITLFQADGIARSGASAVFASGLIIQNNTFTDLNNVCKGQPIAWVDSNSFARINQDHFTGVNLPGSDTYFTRNLGETTWGVASDANNPHGDYHQIGTQGAMAYSLYNVYSAGNYMYPNPNTPDAMQGIFWCDWDRDPNVVDSCAIGNVFPCAPTHGISIGEASKGFYAKNIFVAANTVLGSAAYVDDMNGAIRIGTGANYASVWGNIFGISAMGSGVRERNNVKWSTYAGVHAAVFPSFAGLATANTRAAIAAALTPAGAGLGLGVSIDAIDWTATTPTAVIKWQNLASGAHWNNPVAPVVSTLVTTELATVLNRRTAQTIAPGAGVEWQSFQADGTTLVQAWTTGTGTIEYGQQMQLRFTTGAVINTVESKAITINGFTETLTYTTAIVIPTVFSTTQPTAGAGVSFFRDTSTTYTSKTRVVGRLKLKMNSAPTADAAIFGQPTSGLLLRVSSARKVTVAAKDSANVVVLVGTTVVDSLGADVVWPTGTWMEIVVDVNFTARTVTLTMNGTTYPVIAFTTSGTGFMRTSTAINIGASGSGPSDNWPSGWNVADISIELNGSAYKTIGNGAAAANANAWKLGSAFI